MQTLLPKQETNRKFRISHRQAELLEAIDSGKYDWIFLIGPVGSNKTFGMAYGDISEAYFFADSFIPVYRTTLADARIGTVLSYLEVLDGLGLEEKLDYKFVSGSEIKITFKHNNSVIQFLPLDQTKDREWRKVKSINATKSSVDEVDSVAESGFNMASSRNGRKNKNGQPSCTTATCNPNDAWVKENIYDPWKKGELPPNIKVIEFNMEDSFLYPTGYYNRYENYPTQWKERYLKNNWNYQDDENSLFKIKMLDSIYVSDYDESAAGFLGTDVAREGKDRSVIAEIKGNVLTNIKIYTRDDLLRLCEPDKRDAPPWGSILGREVMRYAFERNIGYTNCACDAVGNGGGVIDHCRDHDFRINEFKAGAAPIKQQGARDRRTPDFSTDYDMLRSQVAHQFALAIENGEFKFYSGCPHLSDLKKELLLHLYTITDKVMKVESKDTMKIRLGKSPDIADAVFIAYFNKIRIIDKRYNKNRIAW